MAAIIIAVILIVGYRSIATIMSTIGQASIDDFKLDFKYTVESISDSYGSRQKFQFTLPKKFTKICFVDSMKNGEFLINPGIIDNYFIKLSVEDDAEYNVFLLTDKELEERFYVDNLDVKSDYLCFENKGLLEIWFEGLGDKACLIKNTETCLG
ncbi:MAG: hypothetical protein AABW92_02185 [Nanoarchaeota archaeon]